MARRASAAGEMVWRRSEATEHGGDRADALAAGCGQDAVTASHVRRRWPKEAQVDFDPAKLSDELRAKLFLGLVVPRPIAVVSTVSRDGYLNVAPFSYFNVVSDSPMAIGFSMTGPKPDKTDKDTLRNVRRAAQGGVGEFVVNVA